MSNIKNFVKLLTSVDSKLKNAEYIERFLTTLITHKQAGGAHWFTSVKKKKINTVRVYLMEAGWKPELAPIQNSSVAFAYTRIKNLGDAPYIQLYVSIPSDQQPVTGTTVIKELFQNLKTKNIEAAMLDVLEDYGY